MSNMRAKMKLHTVTQVGDGTAVTGEKLSFHAVAKPRYEGDGADEDNTYAKFSPSASCEIHVANPALIGKFVPGSTYYVDFTAVEQ